MKSEDKDQESVKQEEGTVAFQVLNSETIPELKAAPTPTPWRFHRWSNSGEDYGILAVVDGKDTSVTHTGDHDDMAPTEEDCHLIVKSVNSHSALVTALETIANHSHNSYENTNSIDVTDGHRCATAIARAALDAMEIDERRHEDRIMPAER